MSTFEKARKFVYRNARPLDFARWQYHFENGSAESVLSALAVYQNEDGGFAHGLEPDSFNPNSAPIQTWQATEILEEINFTDSSHPVIQGILRYLASGADFDKEHGQWLNVVPSNNDYPCAIWWTYGENGSEFKYNPTACLAGFIIRFADKDSELYLQGCEIAKQAFDWFTKNAPFDESHITNCFIRLYEYLTSANGRLVDMELFKAKLKEQVNANICRDTQKWSKEYVALPSSFIQSKNSIFYKDNAILLEEECRLIKETQLVDGSYPLPWTWYNDYEEFKVSENQWKGAIAVNNMLILKEFGGDVQ